MGAAELLQRIRSDRFTLDVADGNLLVMPASKLTDSLRRALRTCKPELIELLAGDRFGNVLPKRACADCNHFGPRGTCFEPVAAGLLTAQEGYGIAWPPDEHAQRCAAFSDTAVAPNQDRRHPLTREQLAAASDEP